MTPPAHVTFAHAGGPDSDSTRSLYLQPSYTPHPNASPACPEMPGWLLLRHEFTDVVGRVIAGYEDAFNWI